MTKRVHPEEYGRASKAMELVARARWVRQHRTDSPTAEAPGGTCDSENRAFSCTITGHRMRQGVSTY